MASGKGVGESLLQVLFRQVEQVSGIAADDPAVCSQEVSPCHVFSSGNDQHELSDVAFVVIVFHPGALVVNVLHGMVSVSYTHLRAHETDSYLVCRLLLEKKKKNYTNHIN